MPFPRAKKNVKSNNLKSNSFELFYSWRMSWAEQNRRSVELKMAEAIVVWNVSIEDFTTYFMLLQPHPLLNFF